MKNPLRAAAAYAELESLRKKTLELTKHIYGAFKKGETIALASYLELVKKLDEQTTSEGARAIAHLALNIALETNKMVRELRDEQIEMRKVLGAKDES